MLRQARYTEKFPGLQNKNSLNIEQCFIIHKCNY